MRETKQKEINGTTYEVLDMPVSMSLDVMMDLVKMLGPALGPVFSGGANLQDVMGQDVGKASFIGDAVRELCSGIDKEKTKAIIKKLADHTTVVGVGNLGKIFDLHFVGKLGELVQWLGFALEAQYSDFFAMLGSATKAAPAIEPKKPKASRSQTD